MEKQWKTVEIALTDTIGGSLRFLDVTYRDNPLEGWDVKPEMTMTIIRRFGSHSRKKELTVDLEWLVNMESPYIVDQIDAAIYQEETQGLCSISQYKNSRDL